MNYTGKELAGKTLYVTSKYSLNIPFKITAQLFADEVYFETWEGRSAMTNKPMGRVKGIHSIEGINKMILEGILSFERIKKSTTKIGG